MFKKTGMTLEVKNGSSKYIHAAGSHPQRGEFWQREEDRALSPGARQAGHAHESASVRSGTGECVYCKYILV